MSPAREQSFDYIIAGGGTSGCVVAARLAEDPGVSVLIIEAGVHSDTLEATQYAMGIPHLWGTENDWNIENEPLRHADLRQIPLTRGKFLGGSSGCNGSICIRGTKQDYDDWGVEGWRGEEVFRYMKKSEAFRDDKKWFRPSDDHGYDGPLSIAAHDLAPISEKIRDAMVEKGFTIEDDLFSTGAKPSGVSHALRTVHQGYRTTAADFVTKTYRRDNITVLSETLVEKVILEQVAQGFKATGIQMIDNGNRTSTAWANKEVIVSGGAYCSPTILLRSGIGAKDELSRAQIECLVDLPGVGKNLTDHPLVVIPYELHPGSNLTYDNEAFGAGKAEANLELWRTGKNGYFSRFPFGMFLWARCDEALKDEPLWAKATKTAASGRDATGATANQPHLEIWNSEAALLPPFPGNGQEFFSMFVILFNQGSRGTVGLNGDNPLANPVVDHNYLADPLDVLVLEEGCSLADAMVRRSKTMSEYVKGTLAEDCPPAMSTGREEWKDFVKKNVRTCYHPSGSCKMTTASSQDPLGVVDPRLRVRGVQNLRVVDVSIMPLVINGHTQMPAYAIGEKAADMIKEDNST